MEAKSLWSTARPVASGANTPRPRPERGARTHRGLTCANCRLRKTRCDGTQPSCKTCEVYQDKCRYEKPPPMTQIVAMAKRLQEAEQTVLELRKALETQARPYGPENPSGVPASQSPGTTSAPPSTASEPTPESTHGFAQSEHRSRETPSEEMLSDLSLDENGKICYYGPTSAVHIPPDLQSRSPNSQGHDEQSSKSDIRTWLTSNAKESRSWEQFAIGNASVQSDIPREVLARFLQIHWTWIAPMFMWVYRPAFMRDMTTGGAYYSPFLLTVLCAHAARFQDGKVGEVLISRARLLLGTEIHRPSSIPTVQALLQLSARDLAYGSTSQAWLYSGMAFRMVSDLGLHHSSGKILSLGYLTPEDLEIRRRLFWSCYFWDKAISLYLGRMPVLIEHTLSHAPEFLDDFAEHEIWSPTCGDSLNLSVLPVGAYPAMKAHSISCFENSCKLAVIINDIILQLYSKRAAPDVEGTLKGIREALDEWRQMSPEHLKYDPDNLPQICPPPHILTQNLLYYTAIILLHRPFYSAAPHHAACRRASDCVEKLLLLLEKTFGFTRITYLMAYCIYTSASVMIHDVKAGDVEARNKMQTFCRALEQGMTTAPLLQRSLDIINNSLHADAPQFSTAREKLAANNSLTSRNYLPAFPYIDLPRDYPSQVNLNGMDLNGFSLLDSFPENHLDNITGEWYLPP